MILAVDTGLATMGWALYDESVHALVDLGVSIAAREGDVPITLDRVQRATAQSRVLADKVAGVSTVVVERLSFPPGGSNAMVPIALSWGAIVGIVSTMKPRPKLLTIAPQKWQREVLGRVADYDEIASAARALLRRCHPAAHAALSLVPDRHKSHAIDAAMIALCAGLRAERCDKLDDVQTVTFGTVKAAISPTSEERRRLRDEHRAKGLCACGRQPDPDHKTCRQCIDQASRARQRLSPR